MPCLYLSFSSAAFLVWGKGEVPDWYSEAQDKFIGKCSILQDNKTSYLRHRSLKAPGYGVALKTL